MIENSKVNIMVCGLTWSGSSAVTDLLKEYDNIGYVPGEFRRPGMIGDHLAERIDQNYPSNIEDYVERKTKKYFSKKRKIKRALSKLSQYTFFSKYQEEFLIDKKRYCYLRELKESFNKLNNKSEKLLLSKKWISNLGQLFAGEKNYCLFDQPILPGQHKSIWPKVFDPLKIIVVYRDPRDQMAEIIRQGHLFYHMRSPTADIYGGDRRGAIAFQIDTLKARINHMQDIYQQLDSSKVLFISFEGLIKNYEISKESIEQFLNIDEQNHSDKMEKLNPEISKRNIGIYNEYLSGVEISMLDELYEWYKSGNFNTKLIVNN